MLFRNTAAQTAPLATSYLFSLLLAPIMLDRLGLAAFGVWAVTGALATYASLLDLGISRSLTRFVALYHAEDDRRAIQESLGLGLLATTIISLLAVAAGVLFAPLLGDALGVASDHDMRVILLSSVAIFALNTYGRVLIVVPVGLQRMVPPNVALTVGNLVNFVFSVVVLLRGADLPEYAIANAAASAVTLVIIAVACATVWHRPYASWPSPARTREIVGFGLKTQASWLADIVNFQTDKIILALMIGPRAAGTYEIASRVVGAVRSISVMSTSAMIPAATSEIVHRGRSAVAALYRDYTRKSLSVGLPLFGIACVTAPYLLPAWLDETPADSVPVLVLLAVAWFVNMLTAVPYVLLQSDGRPGLTASTTLLMAALNVAFTVALAPLFGLWGVLGGTIAAVTVGTIVLLVRFHRIYDSPLDDLLSSAGPPIALVVGLAAPFALWYLLPGTDAPDDRAIGFAGLAVSGLLYTSAYWVAASRLGILPAKLTLRRVGRRAGAVG